MTGRGKQAHDLLDRYIAARRESELAHYRQAAAYHQWEGFRDAAKEAAALANSLWEELTQAADKAADPEGNDDARSI